MFLSLYLSCFLTCSLPLFHIIHYIYVFFLSRYLSWYFSLYSIFTIKGCSWFPYPSLPCLLPQFKISPSLPVSLFDVLLTSFSENTWVSFLCLNSLILHLHPYPLCPKNLLSFIWPCLCSFHLGDTLDKKLHTNYKGGLNKISVLWILFCCCPMYSYFAKTHPILCQLIFFCLSKYSF